MALGAQLKVDEFARKFSESVLREAKAEHDWVFGSVAPVTSEASKRSAPSSWHGSEAKKVICTFTRLGPLMYLCR